MEAQAGTVASGLTEPETDGNAGLAAAEARCRVCGPAAWAPLPVVSRDELGGRQSQSPILATHGAPWEARAGSSPPLGNSCQRPDSCIPLAGHSCP